MNRKVVVHSNAKRLVQVVGAALLIAATLTGLKRLSEWRKADSDPVQTPVASVTILSPIEGPSTIVVGRSSVIDADTLEIHGKRIRLEGVDAPEGSQRCGAVGQEWACGQQAAMALSGWLGERTVSCNPKGQDRYERLLARCFVDSEDVQSWLVLNGWALAYRQYSTDYVAAEEVAQSRKAGLWQGEFVPPWDWRDRQKAP